MRDIAHTWAAPDGRRMTEVETGRALPDSLVLQVVSDVSVRTRSYAYGGKE